jgi:hypothetical protein
MVVDPTLGAIDQGTIFTCGCAEDYDGCTVHGLVITARCDIAQDKVPVFNYIPVVTLDDWLHRDGRVILSSRIERHHMGSLRNMLKNAGHADSILNVQAPRSVLKTLFPEEETGKKARKARQAFADAVEHYELAVKCTSSSPIHRDILTLAKTHKSALDTLIKGSSTSQVDLKMSPRGAAMR